MEPKVFHSFRIKREKRNPHLRQRSREQERYSASTSSGDAAAKAISLSRTKSRFENENEKRIGKFVYMISMHERVVGNLDMLLYMTRSSFDPNDKSIIYEGSANPVAPTIQLTRNQVDKGMIGSIGRATY
ncbi:hypothetical protein Fmac_005153 [Flemingia macrophylla]|uniref:Uncharacterized protein n=1 Tax=Flemingia macrophylla TaxID=520843 RepID=A0ABD1N7B9_9FABA